MKKKLKVLLGMASLMVATMIGSTWATNTNSIMTGNEFQTAYYQTELVEEFKSPKDWKPGVETEKKVWLENTGEVPVITRAVLNQEWVRTENVYAVTEPGKEAEAIPPLKGEKYPLTFDGDEYAAQINFNEDAVVMLRKDGSTGNPFGVAYVDSLEEAEGKWLLASEEPDADGNWYVYYIGVVDPKSETPALIESVTMNPKVENTVLKSRTYFVEENGEYKKVTVDEVNSEYGYDCAEYTLTVTMTTVQATGDAVEDMFTTTTHKEIVNYLVKDIAGTGIYVAEGEKILTMEDRNGNLGYVPQGAGSKTEDGNWFMSFTDMIPGGIYKDEMLIENDTYYNFYLYMQAVPRDQSEIKDELLEKISMKVYHDGELIYDGTASGAKNTADVTLQNKVALGLHRGQEDSKIEVELQLDPTLELEKDGTFKYADVLTKIDWEFWVVRKTTDRDSDPDPKPTSPTVPTTTPTPTSTPDLPVDVIEADDLFGVLGEDYEMLPVGVLGATGDDTPILPVAAAMLVCAGFMAFVIVRRKKESYEE